MTVCTIDGDFLISGSNVQRISKAEGIFAFVCRILSGNDIFIARNGDSFFRQAFHIVGIERNLVIMFPLALAFIRDSNQIIVTFYSGYGIRIDSTLDRFRIHGQPVFIDSNSAIPLGLYFQSIRCIETAVCGCCLYSDCSISNIDSASCRIESGKIDFCRMIICIRYFQCLSGKGCFFNIRMGISINGTLNGSRIYRQSVFIDSDSAVFFRYDF